MKMQCSKCGKTADYSPLRLGRLCGKCKQGRWIPMKDKFGKEMKRPFAKDKRPKKEDRYKVINLPDNPDYKIDFVDDRISVTKNDEDN